MLQPTCEQLNIIVATKLHQSCSEELNKVGLMLSLSSDEGLKPSFINKLFKFLLFLGWVRFLAFLWWWWTLLIALILTWSLLFIIQPFPELRLQTISTFIRSWSIINKRAYFGQCPATKICNLCLIWKETTSDDVQRQAKWLHIVFFSIQKVYKLPSVVHDQLVPSDQLWVIFAFHSLHTQMHQIFLVVGQ